MMLQEPGVFRVEQEYQALFPREWSSFQTVSLPRLQDVLREFWQQP